MDDLRFDRWVQSLALPGSRRRFLAGLAAGALGLAGVDRAGARTCSATGAVCREHGNCCSGLCGPKDRTGRRRCACRADGDCPTPAVCHAVACRDGACIASAVADGTGCAAPGGAVGTCRSGSCATPTTTTTANPLAPFLAACTANAECVPSAPGLMGTCACHRRDCDGGGQCAARGGCGEAATVYTPELETGAVCVRDPTATDCAASACPAGQVCGTVPETGDTYCYVLTLPL